MCVCVGCAVILCVGQEFLCVCACKRGRGGWVRCVSVPWINSFSESEKKNPSYLDPEATDDAVSQSHDSCDFPNRDYHHHNDSDLEYLQIAGSS